MSWEATYEIFGYVGRASLAALLLATGSAIVGQWRGARALAQLAVACSLAVVVFSVAMLGYALSLPATEDASQKATMLAQTISEIMNCAFAALPNAAIGCVGGALVWVVANRKLGRGARGE